MFIKKVIIGLLSFYAFEVKRASIKDDPTPLSESAIERSYESRNIRQSKRKKTKLYDKRKWKEKRQYHEKHYKYKGTNAKDTRFSNQQKLRLMFRNS